MGHKDGGRQYAHRLFWPGDGAQAGETQWFCLSGIEAGVSPSQQRYAKHRSDSGSQGTSLGTETAMLRL